MEKDLRLVKLNSDYCDFLRKFDNRVPYNANNKKLRPFIGVLFTVNNCNYFAPLSSPKSKHLKIKSNIDILKINEGKLGVINFNNMVPVKENNVELLTINNNLFQSSESKYEKLLIEQLEWLNRNKKRVYSYSKRLYDFYLNDKLSNSMLERCCNFPLLENKCIEYNKEFVK